MANSSDTHHYENDVPFKVPSGWVWTIINEVGNIVTGGTPQKDIKEYYGGSIPFYKPNDLEQGINTLTAADHLSILGFEQSRKLPINSVLVTCIGATIGKTGRILKEGTCNQQINAVIHNQSINPLYLYYILVSRYFQHLIRSNASATTLPILNKSNFSKLRIPLPPLSEQQRIVEEIERWFKLIDIIEQGKADLQTTIKQAKNKILDLAIHGRLVPQVPNDEPASELLKRINPKAQITCDNEHSRKLRAKGWVQCTLNDVFTIIMGQSPDGNSINEKNGVEFHQGKLFFSQKELLKSPFYTTSPVKIAEPNSLVLCVRAPVGDINTLDRRICIGRGLCNLRPNSALDLGFVYYSMLQHKAPLENKATGSTFKSISKNIICKEYFDLPPLAEQKRIVKKIEELFLVIDTVEQALQA